MRIGFFDSGLGGLLMLESCKKHNPYHEYIYVGDTENLPYGPRDSLEIYELMTPYLLWLLKDQYCDRVIIACNTASVRALHLFIQAFPEHAEKLINITDSTVDFLNQLSQKKESILVLATQGTVKSNIYYTSTAQVAMPGLVELIESNALESGSAMVDDILLYYPNIQKVLLGCTHYVYLQKSLQEKYPYIQFIGQDVLLAKLISQLPPSKEKTYTSYSVSAGADIYNAKYGKEFNTLNLKK